jgi:hypothetical protein
MSGEAFQDARHLRPAEVRTEVLIKVRDFSLGVLFLDNVKMGGCGTAGDAF